MNSRGSDLAQPVPASNVTPAPHYLRMSLVDKPGALAKIATALGGAGISIDRMRQYAHSDADAAPVLIVTHKCTRSALDQAILAMAETRVLTSDPVVLRIENI